MPDSPDTFYACCVIAEASEIDPARRGAWEFHNQDTQGLTDTPEKMLTVGLSPTGAAPATHYLCTRHADKKELDRIEAYQQARTARGVPRVPVVYHVAAESFTPNETTKATLAAHQLMVLTQLGLRRIT